MLDEGNGSNRRGRNRLGRGGVTYRVGPEGQLDLIAILYAFDHVLNDIVAEGKAESLQGKGIARLGRALQLEAAVGYR